MPLRQRVLSLRATESGSALSGFFPAIRTNRKRDVMHDDGLRRHDVSSPQRHDEFPMLPVCDLTHSGQTLNSGTHSHNRCILQRSNHGNQAMLIRCFVDRHVKISVELDPSRRMRGSAHFVVQFLGPVEDLLGEERHCNFQSKRLNPLTNLIHLAKIVLIELGNDAPMMGIDTDQTLRCKVAERFSHGRRADLELSGQVGLHQTSSARKLTIKNGHSDGLSHIHMRRLTTTRHGRPKACKRVVRRCDFGHTLNIVPGTTNSPVTVRTRPSELDQFTHTQQTTTVQEKKAREQP